MRELCRGCACQCVLCVTALWLCPTTRTAPHHDVLYRLYTVHVQPLCGVCTLYIHMYDVAVLYCSYMCTCTLRYSYYE